MFILLQKWVIHRFIIKYLSSPYVQYLQPLYDAYGINYSGGCFCCIFLGGVLIVVLVFTDSHHEVIYNFEPFKMGCLPVCDQMSEISLNASLLTL